MNIKSIFLGLAVAGFSAGQLEDNTISLDGPPHPPKLNCTVGVDTQACTLPNGDEGFFVCRDHGGCHKHDRDGPGHGHDHAEGGGRWGGRALGLLGLGSSHHRGGKDHDHSHDHSHDHGRHGGDHGGRQGGDHGHHGGDNGGHHGRGHGPHGPPLLGPTVCVPKDGLPPHHMFPLEGGHGRHGGPRPPAPTCGCCNATCPTPLTLECGCDCEIPHGPMEGEKGMLVTITRLGRNSTKSVSEKRCIPRGGYADATKVQVECVAETECNKEDEEVADAMMSVARREEEEGEQWN